MALSRSLAAASAAALHQIIAHALAIAQAAVFWLLIRPLHGLRALLLRTSRKAWKLFLAPMAVALSLAMLFGFLLGFVLSQVAVYLEVFPKRRVAAPVLPALDVAPRRRKHGEWEPPRPRKQTLRFDERPPAESSPPSLETSAHETDDDGFDWKNESSVPSSDDDSDYLGYTEGEEAAVESSSTAATSTVTSPKYAGPVGMGFYAQFRPDPSDSTDTLRDDVDDDGYASPGRSRSRSEISFRRSTGSPLASSPLSTPPSGSPLVSRSMSRVHSLTQISNPIYEEDEA